VVRRHRSPDGDHWFGGHATGVHEPDPVLLLHLDHDPALGFDFLDGGTIQFRIPLDALAERDWDRVTAYADSR
jgi:hypothetical protein